MSAIALPKKYALVPGKPANAIAKRLGIKFNGEVRPNDVQAYDVTEGWILTTKGETLYGAVEPFWRVWYACPKGLATRQRELFKAVAKAWL